MPKKALVLDERNDAMLGGDGFAAPPTFLVGSTGDTICPPREHSDLYVDALREHAIDHYCESPLFDFALSLCPDSGLFPTLSSPPCLQTCAATWVSMVLLWARILRGGHHGLCAGYGDLALGRKTTMAPRVLVYWFRSRICHAAGHQAQRRRRR